MKTLNALLKEMPAGWYIGKKTVPGCCKHEKSKDVYQIFENARDVEDCDSIAEDTDLRKALDSALNEAS